MTLNFDAHYDNKTSAKERGKSLEIRTRKKVRRYKVDDGLMRGAQTKICDYFFEVGAISNVFYVELKGTDYDVAIEQLRNVITHPEIQNRHLRACKEAHIVTSRIRPSDNIKRQRKKDKFMREMRMNLVFKNSPHIIHV